MFLTNGSKRFDPAYKLDQISFNLENASITKLGLSATKNISTIKKDRFPIKFIDASIYFALEKLRKSME